MVGDKNTNIAVFQAPDDILYLFYLDRVDTGKRFIEHNKLWIVGKTTGNLRSTALTSRQLVTQVLANLLQIEIIDKAFQFLHLILAWLARHLQDRQDIILHTHLAKNAGFLWQITDSGTGTLVHRITSDILIVQIHMTCIGYYQSCRHIERGGLARTIRTEQTHNLTLLYVDGYSIGNSSLTIALNQALGSQNHVLVGIHL